MQNSLTYQIITEADFDNLPEIFNSKPDYIEIEIGLIKKYSLPINNPKNKPKKKKNLLLELERRKELPKLNLNLKDSSTKIIIAYISDKSTNYRSLRKIVKFMKGFNCDIYKLKVNLQNNSQNIDLIRLLVSKSNNEKMIIEVQGKYVEFWKHSGELLGSYKL
jgi:Type I 3-dehydroquinase